MEALCPSPGMLWVYRAAGGLGWSVPSLLAASNNSFQADTALAFFPGARFTAFRLRP
jgi:hypothetical protein